MAGVGIEESYLYSVDEYIGFFKAMGYKKIKRKKLKKGVSVFIQE